MASVILDFYDEDAPNTLLGSLEDDDLESLEHRPALFDLGALVFRVPKAIADDNATLLRKTNLVRVRYPTPHGTTRKWAGVLKDFKTVIISHGEQHGEYVEWTAPGALFMWSYAALGTASTVSDQPARGSLNDVPAREWIWVNEPYGAIATRLFEEGRHNPYPGAAAADSPLEDWDITFDRVNDSAGNPWANIAEEFRVPIGANVLEVLARLATAGDFFLVVDADLTLHAYQEYADWATDRTGSFGAGNVRWEKSVNILTELSRSSEAIPITHLIQRDSDGNSSTEVASGYTSGREHFGYVEAESTNDDATLNKIAQRAIDASGEDAEQFAFEVIPGNDEAAGEYFPWLHYDLGDLVTVHAGTSGYDLDEASLRLVAWRIVLDEASESDNAQQAYRSLHVVPELAYRPFHTYSAIRDQLGDPGSTPGCTCMRFCTPPYAGTGTTTRLYYSQGAAGFSIDEASGWIDDTAAQGVKLLKTAPDGTLSSGGGGDTWAFVNAAAGSWRGNVDPYGFQITSSSLLATIQAGGAEWVGYAVTRSRTGIGVHDDEQENFPTGILRIYRVGTGFIGTAMDFYTGSGLRFPQSTTLMPREFGGQTLAAVPGAALNDWLIWEPGTRHVTPTSGATGSTIKFVSDSDTDLPAEEAIPGDATLNSWMDLVVSGDGGTDGCPVLDTVPQGAEQEGTSGFPSRSDHQHAHGLISLDGTNYHDVGDLSNYLHTAAADPTATDDLSAGYDVGTHWINSLTGDIFFAVDVTDGAAVWQQIGTSSGLGVFVKTTDGGQHVVNTVPAAGSTETLDLADGNVHDVTLDDDVTFTFTGATDAVGSQWWLIMRQDGVGGRVPTFPAEVIWPNDTEPTWSTDPDAVDVIEFLSVDGGTTWFGDAGGGSGSGITLSDDTPLVEAGGGDPGVGTEASRSDHVHPVATSGSGVGPILIADDHSTPLIFDDLLQTEAGDDLLYADP